MRASPSLSQLWQPHTGLCHLCRACEQQRSCSPGFCRKELHATEGAVEVRRARRRLEDTVTDERVGLFTPDKKRGTADGAGRAANLAARRGTVCGEVGRVPRFPQLTVHTLYARGSPAEHCRGSRGSRGGYPLAALGSEDWCDAIHAGVFSDGRPSVHGVAPSPTAPASSRGRAGVTPASPET